MKTRHYKTLEGLLKQADRFTLDDFLSGFFERKKKDGFTTLTKYELDESAKLRSASLFAHRLWARPKGDDIDRIFNYNGTNYGIFRRLWIEKDGRVTYCAGQDYQGEIRHIQYLLRKNS